MAQPHSIKEYYVGMTVLVTGGSGFLGKAIIEKLLRTCIDIKTVYALVRNKRGISSEDRLAKLKSSEIFNRIRAENPKFLGKLYCVTGDISENQLGLNTADEELLMKTVNIIIHSAATVRFSEPIKIAYSTNVLGTKRILELSRKMKHLKGIVHISTAFSNPNQLYVEEKVYESSQTLPLEWYTTCTHTFESDDAINIMEKIHGKFPNTYTLTKYMTEQLVEDYRTRFNLPVVIVRPSIVACSFEEPFAGWVDNLNGITGACIEVGRGTIGSVLANKRTTMDVVPLDFVFNVVIVSAWFDALQPTKNIRVINFTSGNQNRITWGSIRTLILRHARNYPSKYTMFYPWVTMWLNPYVHWFIELFHTFLPAFLADVVMRFMGQKPMMYNIQKKFRAAVVAERFFTTQDWNFEFTNVQQMVEVAGKATDGSEFPFDIRVLSWEDYVLRMVFGTQKYILKCDEKSRPRAQQMLKLMYAVWCLYYGCLLSFVFWIVYQIALL